MNTTTNAAATTTSYYWPARRECGKCERCGKRVTDGTVWTDGENEMLLGADCASAVGFQAAWSEAMTQSAIDTAISMAAEPGFVGSFCRSIRDRMMAGQNLSSRQAETFGGIVHKRFLPSLRQKNAIACGYKPADGSDHELGRGAFDYVKA